MTTENLGDDHRCRDRDDNVRPFYNHLYSRPCSGDNQCPWLLMREGRRSRIKRPIAQQNQTDRYIAIFTARLMIHIEVWTSRFSSSKLLRFGNASQLWSLPSCVWISFGVGFSTSLNNSGCLTRMYQHCQINQSWFKASVLDVDLACALRECVRVVCVWCVLLQLVL